MPTPTWVFDHPGPFPFSISDIIISDTDRESSYSKFVKETILTITLNKISGDIEKYVITSNVKDWAENSTTMNMEETIKATHEIKIKIPTDICLVLDYSGSMNAINSEGQSRWESVKEAANMFNALYGATKSSFRAFDNIGVV